eukprot:9281251-Karenia_brevis.AAC.1
MSVAILAQVGTANRLGCSYFSGQGDLKLSRDLAGSLPQVAVLCILIIRTSLLGETFPAELASCCHLLSPSYLCAMLNDAETPVMANSSEISDSVLATMSLPNFQVPPSWPSPPAAAASA